MDDSGPMTVGQVDGSTDWFNADQQASKFDIKYAILALPVGIVVLFILWQFISWFGFLLRAGALAVVAVLLLLYKKREQ